MPLAQLKLIEGALSRDQEQEMIRKVTDAIVSVEGENMRRYTWVLVEHVKSGYWAVGGTPVTTDSVKALAAGKQPHHPRGD